MYKNYKVSERYRKQKMAEKPVTNIIETTDIEVLNKISIQKGFLIFHTITFVKKRKNMKATTKNIQPILDQHNANAFNGKMYITNP